MKIEWFEDYNWSLESLPYDFSFEIDLAEDNFYLPIIENWDLWEPHYHIVKYHQYREWLVKTWTLLHHHKKKIHYVTI